MTYLTARQAWRWIARKFERSNPGYGICREINLLTRDGRIRMEVRDAMLIALMEARPRASKMVRYVHFRQSVPSPATYWWPIGSKKGADAGRVERALLCRLLAESTPHDWEAPE
jgi:hypothetical protein